MNESHKHTYFTWMHISGTVNPADIASRGVSRDELRNNDLWCHGPTWISKGKIYNSSTKIYGRLADNAQLYLLKETSMLNPSANTSSDKKSFNDILFDVTLSKKMVLSHILRMGAWCIRFINNCKSLELHGPLTIEEISCIKKGGLYSVNDHIIHSPMILC
ncbi:hypothetical protein RF11_03887 [Thelohanellus kitauei]|uniref:Uncharacterized protein n=1 Tax=Thelohanellus kitauei TaxID=669202 RepID=A0A0C2IGM9_THEKT|nr:hypothetical protein RF11_03887 [Thelohanellus kitauei]